MKLTPLVMLDAVGANRTPSTVKLLVKSANINRAAEAMKFMVERLGYTEERAKAVLSKYSPLQ